MEMLHLRLRGRLRSLRVGPTFNRIVFEDCVEKLLCWLAQCRHRMVEVYQFKYEMIIKRGSATARCRIYVEKARECHDGVIAQLVERVLSMHEALGSTPSNSIFLLLFYHHKCAIYGTQAWYDGDYEEYVVMMPRITLIRSSLELSSWKPRCLCGEQGRTGCRSASGSRQRP
jgi:hypothetical protein